MRRVDQWREHGATILSGVDPWVTTDRFCKTRICTRQATTHIDPIQWRAEPPCQARQADTEPRKSIKVANISAKMVV
jgi:hypothetical protein